MANDLPNSRAAAIAAGASHYYTGKPCKHGHLSRRRCPGGDCLECVRLRLLAYRHKYPEISYATTKRYRARNPETAKASKAAEYRKHIDRYRATNAAYNSTRRKELAQKTAAWRAANPGRANAYVMARLCAKDLRTPKWANLQEISNIYKEVPAGHHVDHILPLRGRYVSGLHVANNLQYLPAAENRAKKNRYDPVWPAPDFQADIERAREAVANWSAQL